MMKPWPFIEVDLPVASVLLKLENRTLVCQSKLRASYCWSNQDKGHLALLVVGVDGGEWGFERSLPGGSPSHLMFIRLF